MKVRGTESAAELLRRIGWLKVLIGCGLDASLVANQFLALASGIQPPRKFEEAREMYADVWLGFSEVELVDLVHEARFGSVDALVVHREEEAPHFETVLVIGQKDREPI